VYVSHGNDADRLATTLVRDKSSVRFYTSRTVNYYLTDGVTRFVSYGPPISTYQIYEDVPVRYRNRSRYQRARVPIKYEPQNERL